MSDKEMVHARAYYESPLATGQTVSTAIDRRIDAPGGALFAREWTPAEVSAAPPLVLLHDSLGCVQLWRDFPAQLADAIRRRVIAYDRLGFGRSDARADRLTTRFIAEEAEIYLPCVLRHLHIDRFVAFGHSVGGGMAIHCGAALAASCAAVIVESAQAFAEDRTLQGVAAARIDFQDSAKLAKLDRLHGHKGPWVLAAWTETWLDPAFASWSLETVLPRVRCPMLAIHGDQDEFGSLRHPEMIRSQAGGRVEMRILEGVGHVPHREQPELIIRLVAEFLATSEE
jgi:pimeloyl-ACP methyl ester carboxylesterase